ncbi:MAG: hypothetical protein RLZZ175_1397 [Bacteroidota bacterium]
MKPIIIISILFILLSIKNSFGQEAKTPLKISDFKFESIFGMNTSEPQKIYCLLGSGFFRTPRSKNSDSLITDWLKGHPQAIVISISSFGPTEIKDPESKMIYCWVIDGKDTLNNFLIKNGCFPGGTMIRPKTWDEMDKREKELYEGTDEKPDVKVYVDKKTFNNFINQIKSAELYARENKLGIWLKAQE